MKRRTLFSVIFILFTSLSIVEAKLIVLKSPNGEIILNIKTGKMINYSCELRVELEN